MKYLTYIFLTLLPSTSYAQIDYKNFEKFYLGGGYDKTNVTGLYAIQNPYTNEISVNQHDSRTTFMMELKGIVSTERSLSTGNFEGIIYLLGRIASMKSGTAVLDDFDSFFDPLTAGHCEHLTLLNEETNSNEKAIFSNNHVVDLSTSWAFKNRNFLMGINLSLRTLGFPARYTTYPTQIPADRYMISTMGGSWKILYGINATYRGSLNDNAALFFFTGINFGVNKKDHNGVKGNTDLSNAIQVRYSPYINPTLFFGKNMGAYLSVYYELMVARENLVQYNPNLKPGAPSDPANPIYYYTKLSENQLQVKLGFYFPTWNN